MSQDLQPGTEGATTPGRAPTIIVPLDGSPHALAALPVAAALAALYGARPHIVHVAAPILPPRELMDKLGVTAEQLRGAVIDQTAGPPAAGIVRLARESQSLLIVMCPWTGMARPRGELGAVAEAVLRSAPCPVVLVPPQRGLRPWALRQMLLPVDGAPTTAAALVPATDLAQRGGAELDMLHVVVSGAPRPTVPGTLTVPRYLDQPQHEWLTWTDEFLARTRALCRCPPAVRTRLFLRTGEPATEIVRFAGAHASDLIVLAWRGHLASDRAATLKAVIREAPCPLLILRAAA